MRQAILQGLKFDDVFARPQLPCAFDQPHGLYPNPPPFPLHFLTGDPIGPMGGQPSIGRGMLPTRVGPAGARGTPVPGYGSYNGT